MVVQVKLYGDDGQSLIEIVVVAEVVEAVVVVVTEL